MAPLVPVAAAGAQPLSSRPLFFYRLHGLSGATQTQSTSSNWSGYAASGASGSYNSLASTWTEPAVSCVANQLTYSANWVGLDGFNDGTVEQIGTEANCINGQAQYYSWYQMYPQNPYEVFTNVAVAAGNSITASVTYNPSTTTTISRHRTITNPGSFTLALTNNTTKLTYTSTITASRSVLRSSAEVITEAPYSNGVLPLANFGVVNYTSTLINGAPLSSASGLQTVTMSNPYGMVATPSAIGSGGESFSISWAASKTTI